MPPASPAISCGRQGWSASADSSPASGKAARSSPENATGRVYGVVYSGLDIGQAFAPLVFAPLLDLHRPADVWLGMAIAQALLITTAVNVRRARRTALAPAAA